jgi:cytochrome c2
VEHGRELFNGKLIGASCATCHRADSEEKLVGPGLKNVAARVSTYQLPQPESTEEYLRTSILHPDAFVVPGYPPSVMPQNFGQVLSPQDINDLIAYLRSL